MKKEALREQIIIKIRNYCSQNADSAIVKKYGRYFKEGYDAWGLTQEKVEFIREEIFDENKDLLNFDDYLNIADILVRGEKYEELWIAFFFVEKFKKQYSKHHFHRIEKWLFGGCIRNWAHCDMLCANILSVFIKNKIIALEDFSNWRTSPDKYQRRAVPVSMLNWLKIETNYGTLLDFLKSMMLDKERVVHQGLGWFLRDAWKKQPEIVENFLLEWKDTSPRLIFQYATEKMDKANKERFRKSKNK